MHHTVGVDPVKSRREEAVDATRSALVEEAVRQFAAGGYAATSLDDVARAARVTKGALYHHFPGGKQALFAAVFAEVDGMLADRIAAGLRQTEDPWDLVESGLDAYLDACRDPVIRRIMFQEGPVALGWDKWRLLDGCHSRLLLDAALQGLVDAGAMRDVPLDLLSRLTFHTLGEAGMSVAEADDEPAAKEAARSLLLQMLKGLAPT